MLFRQTFLIGLFMLFGLTFLPCTVFAGGQVQFSWAVLIDTPDGKKALEARLPISLASGSTLQIYIEQQPGAYIYLYLLDSMGELTFLFPEKADSYTSSPPGDKKITIPAGTKRFELVPPAGQEKLYLLGSAARLVNLEELTAKYLEQPDPGRRGAVIMELKKLQRSHSGLAQTIETSVPVAGTVLTRGDQADRFVVVKVNAVDFYSKILRINHE